MVVKIDNTQKIKKNFVRDGEKGERENDQAESQLSTSTHWEMAVDLQEGL